MMKAVVKAKAAPGLWLEEVPVPKVGGDDVLIRVLKASICGTDVHIYNWDAWAQKTIPVPMTIGHEFVGVTDSVGDHVKGFAQGDRRGRQCRGGYNRMATQRRGYNTGHEL
jgi:threonine 3-dehydrogenase